jgi:CheY-like chemotaxis protein
MFDFNKPFLLCVDDDPDILNQYRAFLGDRYNIVTASSGLEALRAMANFKPDTILLDVMMPDMDGYEVSARLQENPDTAWIPVIFVSALGDEQDRARAFAVGAVDYLVKPVNRQTVRELVERHQTTGERWQMTREMASTPPRQPDTPSGSVQEYICTRLGLAGTQKVELLAVPDKELYSAAGNLGLEEIEVARAIADFKGLPFVEFIDPDSIRLGKLPAPFSRANNAVVIKWRGQDTLVVSNPFDMMLQDSLSAVLEPALLETMAITDPSNIAMLFEKEPAPYITDRIITLAVLKGVSAFKIESGDIRYSIQMESGGEFTEFSSLRRDTGFRLVARFKVLAGIAAADKDKGHDGVYTHPVGNKSCYLRLFVTKTVYGDSLLVRIIDVS